MMLMIIVIERTPSRRSVVAALRLFGFLKAGTPLEIASTPVRAAHPDEKARARRNTNASVVMPFSYVGDGWTARSADSACGRVPNRSRLKPHTAIPNTASMKP